MVLWSEQYLTDWLIHLIDEYAKRFNRGPPMLQMGGDLVDQAFLIETALHRGEEIRDEEIHWPSSPGELI